MILAQIRQSPVSSLRLPIMALVLLALILAIWAGLIRMGWVIPIIRPTLPAIHGPLMIGGFLGTLIALERAVALQRSWTYAVPLVGGLGAVALALWLAWYDVARRTVRRPGLTRFIAVNLLIGYFWVGVGGLLGVRFAGLMAGPAYDAWLHALLLGFVFSMIFAHAPIILPAVAQIKIPFHSVLYGPVIMMQLGLLIRVVGDLALWRPVRMWGGLLNGLAILWFFLTIAGLAIRERRRYKGQLAQRA